MNEQDYEKYVVNKYITMTYSKYNLILDAKITDPRKWDMIKINHNSNYSRYFIGYMYRLVKHYGSGNIFHDSHWLPNWGILTINKRNLIREINIYFNRVRVNQLVCKNIPFDVVRLIYFYL